MVVLEDPAESRYRKLVIAPDGSIAGAVLLGYPLEAAGVVEAARTGLDVRNLLDTLRRGDWSAFVDAGQDEAAA